MLDSFFFYFAAIALVLAGIARLIRAVVRHTNIKKQEEHVRLSRLEKWLPKRLRIFSNILFISCALSAVLGVSMHFYGGQVTEALGMDLSQSELDEGVSVLLKRAAEARAIDIATSQLALLYGTEAEGYDVSIAETDGYLHYRTENLISMPYGDREMGLFIQVFPKEMSRFQLTGDVALDKEDKIVYPESWGVRPEEYSDYETIIAAGKTKVTLTELLENADKYDGKYVVIRDNIAADQNRSDRSLLSAYLVKNNEIQYDIALNVFYGHMDTATQWWEESPNGALINTEGFFHKGLNICTLEAMAVSYKK